MSVSVDNIAEKAFDNFKRITPALVAVALLTGFLTLLPEKVLKRMSLDNLPVIWKRIIGLSFLLSVALIVTIIVFTVISKIVQKYNAKRLRINLRKRLKILSLNQKRIIIKALQSKEKCIKLDMNSGDARYLVDNYFLYRPEQPVSFGYDDGIIVKYVPQPWLMDLYNKEPELFIE